MGAERALFNRQVKITAANASTPTTAAMIAVNAAIDRGMSG